MDRRHPRSSRRARRPAHLRGFTLVELIISMAAGLAVSTAAILLARNASRFFQHEARMSSAHMAAVLGLNRITADVQRAALMSSPNVQLDPSVCGAPVAWPEGPRRLAGITIQRNGSVGAHPADLVQSTVNNMRPDSLVIGGTFSTNEQFLVRAVIAGGSGHLVHLQTDTPAMRRTLRRLATPTAHGLDAVFRPGRMLRVIMPGQSKYMYGVITALDVLGTPNDPASVIVHLAADPALPLKADGDCGIAGIGVGALANPVARIRYDVRSLATHPSYGPLVAPATAEVQAAQQVTGDAGRTELVRVELDGNNAEMPDTLELVAEYTVDFKLGISVSSTANTPTPNPVITRYPIQQAEFNEIYLAAAEVTDGGHPESIRAVQIRLSTRTRAPDRDANLDVGTGPDARPLRFFIPNVVPGIGTPADVTPALAVPVYARMRTLYAEVALPNQIGAQIWQP